MYLRMISPLLFFDQKNFQENIQFNYCFDPCRTRIYSLSFGYSALSYYKLHDAILVFYIRTISKIKLMRIQHEGNKTV